MSFLELVLAIARNTFLESIRQPVVLVVTVVATLLVILSNPFATFTLDDDQRMFVDIGMSTVFLAGMVLASFVATSVLSREIENRTVLTVVSKPVPRPVFVLGKYLGVAGAIIVTLTFLSLVFMLTELHGTMQTAASDYHLPVIVFGAAAALLGIAAATWCNYFYGWAFGATALGFLTPLAAIAYVLALLFEDDFTPQAIGTEFEGVIWVALAVQTLAVLVLAAIAIAASTRLGQVLTLIVTSGFFLLGLFSDWLFARSALDKAGYISRVTVEGGAGATTWDHVSLWLLETAHAIVPNFQLFWLADAVNQERGIPFTYVFNALPYSLLLIAAALAVATALFQRREVG